MATIITLPESLEAQLQQQATAQQRSVEEIALALLHEAVTARLASPELSAVVGRITAMSPSPYGLRPPQGPLADALRHAPQPQDEQHAVDWDEDWATIEQELRAMTRADDEREGRGG